MKKLLLLLIVVCFQLTVHAQTVSDTYTAPSSVCIDGASTPVGSVQFSYSDFAPPSVSGCEISQVDVVINWSKSDGSCPNPTSNGCSFHNDVGFTLNGPSGSEVLAIGNISLNNNGLSTWDGCQSTAGAYTTRFRQSGSIIPNGSAPANGTWRPDPSGGGNLNDYIGQSAIGTWSLTASDVYNGTDPLLVAGYTVDIWTSTDNTPPTFTSGPANQTVYTSNTTGGCAATVTWSAPLATDVCGGVVVEQIAGQNSGTQLPVGVNTIVYQARDRYGNTTSGNGNYSFTITVVDDEAPVISGCPVSFTAASPCGNNVTWVAPTASDNCGVISFNQTGLASGSNFPPGVTTITYTALDAAGNSSVCSFDVTVTDAELPQIVCPSGPITGVTPSNSCTTPLTYTVTGLDNCPGVTITGSSLPNVVTPDVNGGNTNFPVGEYTLTFTAQDAAGNTAQCSFDVEVQDNIVPVISCPGNIQVSANGVCQGTATWSDATATDACGIDQIVRTGTNTQFSSGDNDFPLGTTTMSYQAFDNNGNFSTCSFNVVVVDDTDPTIQCPTLNDVSIVYTTGQCGANVSWPLPVLNDNCALATNPLDRTDNEPFANGGLFSNGSYTISYEVEDNAGNTNDCDFSFTIADSEPPTWADCPTDFTVNSDPGVCTAVVSFDIEAADNCTSNPPETLISQANLGDGDTFPIGDTEVEYTTQDGAGNVIVSNCLFTVTVEDNEFPIVTPACPSDFTVTFPNCEYIVADSSGSGLITDNCNIASVVQTPTGVITEETTVTLTATDDAGNASTCAWTISPFDNTDPIINNCPDRFLVDANAFDCSFVMPEFDANDLQATDDCGTTLEFNQSPAPGTTSSLDSVLVTISVSDGTNTVPCEFYAVANDVTAPSISCPDDMIEQVDANCEFTLPSYLSDINSLSDNCSDNADINLVQTQANNNPISGAGTEETVTITATDLNGNQASCTFTVTLEDDIAPTLVCPATITKNFNANCQYVLEDLTNNVTNAADNCTSVGNLSLSQAPFVGTSIGTSTTVTFTLTDESGNFTECVSSLELVDNTPPTAVCPQTQVETVGPNCSFDLVDYTGLVNASDNCSSVTVQQLGATAAGSTFNLSDSPVSVEMTITAGTLTTTCSFNVVLQDVTAPTLACPSTITVAGNANCEFTAANYIGQVQANIGTSDNCTANGSMTYSQLPTVGTSLSGSTTVTVTGTDASGNSSSCSFLVVVEDQTNPTITCPLVAISEVADANCFITLDDYRSLADVDDNCDQNLTVVQSPAAGFTTSSGGANQSVMLTVTDDNGNSANCSFTVFNVDETAPSIGCPTVGPVSAEANCEYILADYTGSATTGDNCDGNVTVTQAPLATTTQSGTTTVTLTATDDAGNISTCTFDVDAVDNTAPTIECPLDQEVSSSIVGGNCVFLIPDLTGSAAVADNCSSQPFTLTQSPSQGTAMTANETITLTVYDDAGNSNSCTFELLLNDDAAPSITCPGDFGVEVDANCEYPVGNYIPLAVASDNCSADPNVTQAILSPTGNPTSIGAGDQLVIELTAADDSSNTASCQFTISAFDVTPPVVNCPTQNDTVSANANCLVPLGNYTGSYLAVDNCDGNITNLTQSPGQGIPVLDSALVTLSATDAAGNSGSCSFWVIREDESAPTIISCPQSIQYVDLDASCQYSIPNLTSLVLVDDNCDDYGELDFIQQPAAGSTGSGTGTSTVLVEVTDGNGNSSTCQLNVAGRDVSAPTLDCPDDEIVYAGANCNYSLQSYSATYSDNCTASASSTSQSPAAGLIGLGVSTVTLSATDASGNVGQCSFTITVNDTVSPLVIGCPSQLGLQIIETENDQGVCGAVVTYSQISAFDNCGFPVIPTLSQGLASGSLFPIDTTQVIWVADDGNGNTTNCEFEVVVLDTEDPIIGCPSNVTVNVDPGTCGAVVTYTLPSVSDNCTNPITPTLEAGLASGATFPEGTTTVTYEAEDEYGNTSDCSFTVTVNDNEPPVITCPENVVVGNDPGLCEAVASYSLPTVTDNCTSGIVPSILAGSTSGSSFPFGITTVTYGAEDASGNTDQCSFTVTVNDVEDPVVTCPNDTLIDCDAPVAYDDATATDNCANTVTITELPNGGFVFGPNTVEFEGDDGNGNTSTCSFTVTIQDTVAPAITTCPADQFEAFDPSCNLSIPDYTGLAGATDNCDNAPLITQSPAAGSTISGTTTVTITAEDFAGNQTACTFTVTDNTPPVVTCPNDQNVGSNINCQYTLLDYTTVSVGTDNCGAATLTQSPAVGTPISDPTTITITAEDDFGNISTCEFDVIPFDNIPPSITCIGNQTALFDANCMYQLPDYTGQAIGQDNCDLSLDITQSPAPGTMISGTTPVTFTATDDGGSSTSCTFTVSPFDNIPPTITCPSTQVAQLDANCGYLLDDYTGLATTDDNCATTITVTQTPAVGSQQSLNAIVTLTAEDENGNATSCLFIVEPEDNIDPTIDCPSDFAVDLDNNCEYVVVDFTVLGTPSDNCSSSFLVSQSPAVGTVVTSPTQITLTVDDGNGNTGTCTFEITPEDNIAPVITCAGDQSVVFDETCQFEIGDYSGLGTATDNCSATTITQSPAAGTFISGASTVTLTAQDADGNMSSCDFMVIPDDQTAPTIICPADLEVSLNSSCAYVVENYTALATATDDCTPNVVVTQNVLVGLVISSPMMVTLTATDDNGNSDDCSFAVIPLDNTPPTIVCPNDLVVDFDANCEFTLTDYRSIVTVADNCVALVSQVPDEGTQITAQTTIVLTVEDGAGNSVNCSFEVIPNDNTLPTLTCPSDQIVELDANCQFELPDYTGSSVVSDNCTASIMPDQFPPTGTFIIASTEVTISVEDNAGNSEECTFVVEPEDNIDPVATVCPVDQVVQLNSNCEYIIPDFTGIMQATDNCDVELNYQQAPVAGFVIEAADVVTVQVAAIDDNGNYALCEFTVTTQDESDPTIQCPASQLLALNASCAFIVPDYTTLAVTNDACGGAVTVTQSPIAGSVITTQLNATLIAEDEDGNTATCTFFVDVIDYEMNVTGTDVTCENGNDGTATVTVTGGQGPYTQDWGGFDPNALAPGIYAVIVEDANGCIITDEVTIGNGPTFQFEMTPSGEVFICEGASLSVNAGPGYADYDWSTGASVQSITVSNEGQYWVTVTTAEGCVADDTVSVSFYNAVVPTIDANADGVLYCSNDTALTYQWYLNGDAIPNATNNYYCPLQSGNYYVVITDQNGCEVTSIIEEHTFADDSPCATSIDEYGLALEVYPNPSNGVYTIKYSLDHQAQLQLTVIDLVGRQVTNEIQLTALSGTRNIDLSGQADGVYILRIVKDGQHMMQERLILVK
ncbi:MAG: HYR domain-containing protein [Flavobacteriales bacterium]|nr:HYR domain-containing protein [Flavobacteriales bacterium]